MALAQHDWTEPEREVVDGFLHGSEIDLEGRTVRGTVLRDVCTEHWRQGQNLELRVRNGTIDGELVLDFIRSSAAVHLRGVRVGPVRLRQTTLGMLVMTDCEVDRIEAVGLETARGVDLNGRFCSRGRVRLVKATIGGDLNCNGARFGRS